MGLVTYTHHMSTKNPDPEPVAPAPEVYKAISAVMADLAKEGISKDQRNVQQGYNFRGIDDVLNALSSLLAKHELVILPRVLSRDCQERQTQKGGTLFYVTEEVEYDFISARDGSKHTTKVFGEAMDSADKATNKAMSAAYKYNAIQSFAIPTKGEDNDADATTPDPGKAKTAAKPAPARTPQAAPKGEAAMPAPKPTNWTGEISEVKEVSGMGQNKKPYIFYAIKFSDGREANTFKGTLAETARNLIYDVSAGGPTVLAEVTKRPDKDAWKLEKIEPIQEGEYEDDSHPTGGFDPNS